jgi:hypothetical protein
MRAHDRGIDEEAFVVALPRECLEQSREST